MIRSEVHVHIGRARKGMKDCLSIRDLPGGRVYYGGVARLQNATFAVQPAGLRRFRETGQKNVHAFVRGDKVQVMSSHPPLSHFLAQMGAGWREVKYNPTKHNTFVLIGTDGREYSTFSAAEVLLVGTKCYAYVGG